MNRGIVIKEGERITTEEFEEGNFPSSIFGHPVHHNAPCQLIPITTEEGKQTKEDKAQVRALEIKKRKERQEKYLRSIEEVIFHDPYTTIKYHDGHEVSVAAIKGDAKIEGDKFDKTIGFYAAIAKDLFGDHFIYRDLVKGAKVFEPGYLEVARTKSRANRKKERQAGAPARAKKAKEREENVKKEKVRKMMTIPSNARAG